MASDRLRNLDELYRLNATFLTFMAAATSFTKAWTNATNPARLEGFDPQLVLEYSKIMITPQL